MIILDPALKNSYAHQAAIGIDRVLGRDLALNVNGVYLRGYNLPGTIDYNPVLSPAWAREPASERSAVLGQSGRDMRRTAAFLVRRPRCCSTRRLAKAGTKG